MQILLSKNQLRMYIFYLAKKYNPLFISMCVYMDIVFIIHPILPIEIHLRTEFIEDNLHEQFILMCRIMNIFVKRHISLSVPSIY